MMQSEHAQQNPRTCQHKVLDWNVPEQRDSYIQSLAEFRRNERTMKPKQIYVPCFICGTQYWTRRLDIHQSCLDCRIVCNRLYQKCHTQHHQPTRNKSRQRTACRAELIRTGIIPRPKRADPDYFREYVKRNNGWNLVKKRAYNRRAHIRLKAKQKWIARFTGRLLD